MTATAVRLPRPWPLLVSLGGTQIVLGVLLWARVGAERCVLPYPLTHLAQSLVTEFLIALVLVTGGSGLMTGNRWGLLWSSIGGGALYVHSVYALHLTLPLSIRSFKIPRMLGDGLSLAITAHCFQSIVSLLVATAALWIVLHECRAFKGRRTRLVSAIAAALCVLAIHASLRMLEAGDRC